MPMATKLVRVVTYYKGAPTHKFAWSLIEMVFTRLPDKLNTIYPFLKTHGHQSRQGADLLWKLYDSLIMWPTWGHVPIWEICISTFTRLKVIKLCRYWLRGGGSVCKHLSVCQLPVFPNNSSKICPIKLKSDMLYCIIVSFGVSTPPQKHHPPLSCQAPPPPSPLKSANCPSPPF